jgi:bifunctional DNase/RNase
MPEPVPIFAAEAVLDEAGVLFEPDDEESQVEEFREFLDQVRPEDFAE